MIYGTIIGIVRKLEYTLLNISDSEEDTHAITIIERLYNTNRIIRLELGDEISIEDNGAVYINKKNGSIKDVRLRNYEGNSSGF